MTGLLSQYYKNFSKLYLEQIEVQKQQYAINIIVSSLHMVQGLQAEKKLIAALFIYVKRALIISQKQNQLKK